MLLTSKTTCFANKSNNVLTNLTVEGLNVVKLLSLRNGVPEVNHLLTTPCLGHG